jgi:hypothetical protein
MALSPYSDPVGAGIRAFRDVVGTVSELETAKSRRELMAEEKADMRLRREREGLRFSEEQKEAEAKQKLRDLYAGMEDEEIASMSEYHNALTENALATKEGRDPKFTPEMEDSVKTAAIHTPFISNDLSKIPEQAQATMDILQFIDKARGQVQPGGKYRFDEDKYPRLISAFNSIYGDTLNQGTDKYGLSVAKDGVKKRAKGIFLDYSNPQMPTVSILLDVKTPVKEGQVFKHIGDDTPRYTVNPSAPGMTEQGNIDLSKRPIVRRADGSISTLSSMSFNDDGKEVLIPMVSDTGKMMKVDEAIAQYRKTGKHLGKFDTIENANAYADAAHSDPMWNKDIETYSAKGQTETSYDAPRTHGATGDPNSAIAQVPVPLLHGQIRELHKNLAALQRIRAQADPVGFAKDWEGRVRTKEQRRKSAAAREQALAKVDTSKGVDEQRKQFMMEYSRLNPDADDKTVAELAKTLIVEKTPKQYLSRTRQEGEEKIFEESHDVGKTWTELSRGPAFRPKAEEGAETTIYGPKGETKKVFVKKGVDYTPPKGWSLKAPEKAETEHEKGMRKLREREVELKEGKETKEAKGLTPAQIRAEKDKIPKILLMAFRKGNKEIEDESQLRLQPAEKTKYKTAKKRMNELVEQGKSAEEAKDIALEEAGGISALQPITKEAITKIENMPRIKKMPRGPAKKKAMEDAARDMGFDPEKPSE